MIARTALGKILVFAIFFVGIGTGAVLDNMYRTRVAASDTNANKGDRPNPQDRGRRDEDQWAKYLGLDQAQKDQIHKILENTRAESSQLRDQVDPKFRAIEEGSREKIRAVLNDEQRKKLDEFRRTHPRGDRGRPPRSSDKDRNNDRDKDKQDKQ